MIRIAQTATPMNRFAPDDPLDPAEEDAASVAGESAAANVPGSDPLARFGAPGDLHADVRQYAYASPGDTGSTGNSATPASRLPLPVRPPARTPRKRRRLGWTPASSC
jgi:hypothetical protein